LAAEGVPGLGGSDVGYLVAKLFGAFAAQIDGEVHARAANRVNAVVVVKFDSSCHVRSFLPFWGFYPYILLFCIVPIR
jgi:hypothetical protein